MLYSINDRDNRKRRTIKKYDTRELSPFGIVVIQF